MLSEIVANFSQRNILIIGDLIADEFVYGEIARVSREAPVMILHYERTETLPGGAANTAANVAALSAGAMMAGVVGRDRAGRQLMLSLRTSQVNTNSIISLAKHTTTTKTRILAGSVHSTRQQVIRIDREPAPLEQADLTIRLREKILPQIGQVDAIIISDYNYGVVNPQLLETLRMAVPKQLPIIVDSRFCLRNCYGFTAATPNQAELEALMGVRLDTEASLCEAGAKLAAELGLEMLLLTRGSAGMILFQKDSPPVQLAAVGSKDAVDVTGAGDTVIAAFTLALASGATAAQAAQIANHAGGLVVMKRGTATVTTKELMESLKNSA